MPVDNAIIIFVKNKIIGNIKTRLAKDIGDKNALRVYEILLEHTYNLVKDVSAQKFIFFSDYFEERPHALPDAQIHVQNGESLGERILNAFDYVFSRGYRNIVIIGSDCFEINKSHLNTAFRQLLSPINLIIGPATDGGYYLLGLRNLVPELFKNKSWSNPALLQQTIDNAKNLKLKYTLLEELNDIDTLEDLENSKLKY